MTIKIAPADVCQCGAAADFGPSWSSATLILIAASVAGCSKKVARTPDPRPVRTVTVDSQADGETVSFTGQIRAKDQVNLAFRLDGRMIERHASVGDVIAAGQVVARLDSQNEQNALRSAEANLASAQAALTQARLTFGRQQELLKDGWTSRARFDDAQEALRTAEAQVESAEAQVRIAQDRLGYTVLRADSPGAVTATGADAGEVVKAGQTIVQLAGQGEPRRRLRHTRAAHPDRSARPGRRACAQRRPAGAGHGPCAPGGAAGRFRDPHLPGQGRHRQSAGGHEARLDGHRAHQARRAGGRRGPGERAHRRRTAIRPSGWSIARPDGVAAPRRRRALRPGRASSISHGLEKGDVVVTAGVQMLRPGQKVRLLGDG